MEFHKVKKVGIVTEASILNNVIKTIGDLGVGGYTVSNVTGKGTKGIRRGTSMLDDLFKNVKIEIIVDEKTAKDIAMGVGDKFFKNFAGIAYMEDVEVICPERLYVAKGRGM